MEFRLVHNKKKIVSTIIFDWIFKETKIYLCAFAVQTESFVLGEMWAPSLSEERVSEANLVPISSRHTWVTPGRHSNSSKTFLKNMQKF